MAQILQIQHILNVAFPHPSKEREREQDFKSLALNFLQKRLALLFIQRRQFFLNNLFRGGTADVANRNSLLGCLVENAVDVLHSLCGKSGAGFLLAHQERYKTSVRNADSIPVGYLSSSCGLLSEWAHRRSAGCPYQCRGQCR